MTTRADRHAVVLLGNPNVGKSSLFSALTGARQKVANFPGVTVEAKLGTLRLENTEITVIDLPGTYSLAARSPDEKVAIDALTGRLEQTPRPDGVILILDAASLDRNLYLGTQVLEFGLPTVIALSMVDVAESRGIRIDIARLSATLGVPVVAVNSPTGEGLAELKQALHRQLHHPAKPVEIPYPPAFGAAVSELHDAVCDLSVQLGFKPTRPEALRLLVDGAGPLFDEVRAAGGSGFEQRHQQLRAAAGDGRSPAMVESQARYGQIAVWLREARQAEPRLERTWTDRVDSILTHKVWGLLVFVAVMALVFQSIYTWSGPLMDAIEGGIGALGAVVANTLPEDSEMLRDLLEKGVFGGVGGILVFLPQILILFLFIAVLEDLGYMSRAAFLMDRLMARFGLSGRSFIPLLSSFACAIPGIMGARVIEDRNTRLTTIMLAPFMSCSARLPVYTLMIAAFVPAETVLGFFSLQGLVLFAMYWVGVLAAIPTALVLKRGILKSKVTPFLMEMPSYKLPRIKNVGRVLFDRGASFVKRAGTIIFAVSILVWAALWFPRDPGIDADHQARAAAEVAGFEAAADKLAREYAPGLNRETLLEDQAIAAALADLEELALADDTERTRDEEGIEDDEALARAEAARRVAYLASLDQLAGQHGSALEVARTLRETESARDEALQTIEFQRRAAHAENSLLGRVGHVIEPAVEPLGWDWRIGMAAIASFPAREVIIATLGTIFALGEEVDEADTGLRASLQAATRRDGSPLFTLATALSVMVFFALCCQCAATLAVMRRETNSWKWPAASFVYMTVLAYVAAAVTYWVARALGG